MTNPIRRPEYSPAETVEQALKRWWIIVLLTVLGGAAGWLFHILEPPVYEATAVITGSMHFEQRQLTQAEEDIAYSNATAVVSAPSVTNQAFADAQAQGLSFNHNTPELFLEIKGSLWELHVRDRTPQVAADLANIWAQRAYKTLNEAREHAYRAEQIQNELTALQNCLSYQIQTSGMSQNSPTSVCENSTLAEVQTAIDNQSSQLIIEKNLSLGVLSILDFTLTGPASVPDSPVLYDRAKLTFAGACIGFIISMWAINFHKVKQYD